MNRARKSRFDLTFNLVAAEQRNIIFVELEFVDVVRHHLLHELFRIFKYLGVIDQNLPNIIAKMIPKGSNEQVTFLVDQERSGPINCRLFNGSPQLQEVIEVPLKFFGFPPNSGGANDNSDIVRRNNFLQLFPQVLPVFSADTT